MKSNLRILIFSVAILIAHPPVIHALEKDHLEVPPHAFVTPGIINTYGISVQNILMKDANSRPYAGMVVLPSFEPEWMVTVAFPQNGWAEVQYIVVDKIIWANVNKDDIKQIIKKAQIPEDLAQEIKDVWTKMLFDVHYSRNPGLGLDGTVYYFIAFDEKAGPLIGTKWSPKEKSAAGQMVAIGDMLKDYVLAENSSRDEISKKIRQSVRKFK